MRPVPVKWSGLREHPYVLLCSVQPLPTYPVFRRTHFYKRAQIRWERVVPLKTHEKTAPCSRRVGTCVLCSLFSIRSVYSIASLLHSQVPAVLCDDSVDMSAFKYFLSPNDPNGVYVLSSICAEVG